MVYEIERSKHNGLSNYRTGRAKRTTVCVGPCNFAARVENGCVRAVVS